jgi:hypothetical protein
MFYSAGMQDRGIPPHPLAPGAHHEARESIRGPRAGGDSTNSRSCLISDTSRLDLITWCRDRELVCASLDEAAALGWITWSQAERLAFLAGSIACGGVL